MSLAEHERVILEVVRDMDGKTDTRTLDIEYYFRSTVLLTPHIKAYLEGFEKQGLVRARTLTWGAGPAWELTPRGAEVLADDGFEQPSAG